jgi:hypothetical protein
LRGAIFEGGFLLGFCLPLKPFSARCSFDIPVATLNRREFSRSFEAEQKKEK